MKKDNVQRFAAARQQLDSERADIQKRLDEINRILDGPHHFTLNHGAGKFRAGGVGTARTSRRRSRGGMSMREAAQQVLKSGPKDMTQLLSGLQKLGYQFTTKNPKNSLGVMLYTNKKLFNSKRGMFSLKS